MEDPDRLLSHARHTLRAWTSGLLRFDEHVRPLKYVIAPDGRLVAPAMVAMLSTLDTALHIPEEDPDGLQLLVELHEFDPDGPDGALADRWRIYHGSPEDVRWAVMDIDLARCHGGTIDGEAMVVPNPLATIEPKLCSMINTNHGEALRNAVQTELSISPSQVVAVGVHPDGLDVRCDHDVVQLPCNLGQDPEVATGALLGSLGVV
ncbi:MAG: hypothetical protein MK101_05045 [Phycisphaerales bacterium]|nr:hypothetical protein [Phycisphaerales bacterium]